MTPETLNLFFAQSFNLHHGAHEQFIGIFMLLPSDPLFNECKALFNWVQFWGIWAAHRITQLIEYRIDAFSSMSRGSIENEMIISQISFYFFVVVYHFQEKDQKIATFDPGPKNHIADDAFQ